MSNHKTSNEPSLIKEGVKAIDMKDLIHAVQSTKKSCINYPHWSQQYTTPLYTKPSNKKKKSKSKPSSPKPSITQISFSINVHTQEFERYSDMMLDNSLIDITIDNKTYTGYITNLRMSSKSDFARMVITTE